MSEAALEGAFVVGGRYALSDRIAQGGMAVVWRGLDLRLHRDVAIKILTKRDDSDRDRVLREARLLAATPHPNVVQVLDVGVDADRPFIVMELLEGVGLDRLLEQQAVSTQEALDLVAAALDGLAAAHARGIVHRDLKPSNLFLARDPGSLESAEESLLSGRRLKILDFGVSRATDRSVPMRSALTTREGAIVGTPEYMAPEQARGLAQIGPAADLYALGVILYECLTGKLPFESPNVGDLIIQIATQPPPRIEELRPDLPTSVAAVVNRAMAKRPEDRFESALAMRKAIEIVRTEVGGELPRQNRIEPTRGARAMAVTLEAPVPTTSARISVAEPPPPASRTGAIAAVALLGVVALLGLGYLATQAAAPGVSPPEGSVPADTTPADTTPAAATDSERAGTSHPTGAAEREAAPEPATPEPATPEPATPEPAGSPSTSTRVDPATGSVGVADAGPVSSPDMARASGGTAAERTTGERPRRTEHRTTMEQPPDGRRRFRDLDY
jgi:serine/threonine protein kinase